jgi:hypothetical protein
VADDAARVGADDAVRWRGIDELASLVGAYCWTERRIFALAGAWASETSEEGGGVDGGDDEGSVFEHELRVFCAALSRRHGALAERWAERLPVRAGLDAGALVQAPGAALEGALDELAASPVAPGMTAVVGALLPRLRDVYAAHLRGAPPVSEGPVMEVLVQAHREIGGEIRGGATLIQRCPDGSGGAATLVQELVREVERAFAGSGIFPAVRPS